MSADAQAVTARATTAMSLPLAPREPEISEDTTQGIVQRLTSFAEGDEAFVTELLQTYVVSCDQGLAELRKHVVARTDADTVARLTHALKGASLNVGAPMLAMLAERVESAARRGDWDEIERGLATLSDRLSRLCRSICADLVRRAA